MVFIFLLMQDNYSFFAQIRKGYSLPYDRCIEAVFSMLNLQPTLANIIEVETNLSPMQIACIHLPDKRAAIIIQQLLQFRADPSHEDINGQNVLFQVAAQGKIQCFRTLLLAGLQIQKTDCIGQTCLYGASQNNHIVIFQHLPIINGDILNRPDNLIGQTPIFYAAMHGHQQLCKLLVQKGANPNLKDLSGKTPKYYAKLYNHHRLYAYLCSLNNTNEKCPMVEQPQPPSEKQHYHLCKINQNGQKTYLNTSELISFRNSYSQIGSLMSNPEQIPEDKLAGDYGEDWRKTGIKIINQLYYLKDSYWFKELGAKFSEYLKEKRIKQRPIDLNTIKIKLQHHCYRNKMEFISEMNLIWKINDKISSKDDNEYIYAQQLKKKFQQSAHEEGLYAFES